MSRQCVFFHSICTTIVFFSRKDNRHESSFGKCSQVQDNTLEIAWRSPLSSPSFLCPLDLIGFTHPLVEMLLPGNFSAFSFLQLSKRCKVCLPGGKGVFKKPFTPWKTSGSNTGDVKSFKYWIEPDWKTNLEPNALIDLQEGDWNEMALYPFYPLIISKASMGAMKSAPWLSHLGTAWCP